MSLGLLLGMQAPERFGATPQQVYRDTLAQIAWVDANVAAIDRVWLTEHHGFPDGYLPSPMIVAGALAACTSRIRIAQGIVVQPFYGHPLRLAEDAAVLDVLSGGRFELGIGMGYRRDEFDAFGLEQSSRRRRFDEGLDIIEAAFRGERFSYEGRHYQVLDGWLRPGPLQQPLPLWLGAATPKSRRRVAERGHNLLISLLTDIEHTKVQFDDFRAAGATGKTALIRECWVGPWSEVEPHLHYTYREVYAPPHVSFVQRQPDGSRRTITDPDDPFYSSEDFWRDRFIVGSPEEVAAEIRRYRETLGIDHLVLHVQQPGMSNEQVMGALERLAFEVVPLLD
jgi:alkanesulfonate monooxygenase SsuD/methylene tetrahydromethanopterin reductase-like flavin-dependent oxidoreductase (luciferase family)